MPHYEKDIRSGFYISDYCHMAACPGFTNPQNRWKHHHCLFECNSYILFKIMKMKNLLSILFFALLICITENALGQNISSPIDTTNFYRIELKDGSTFFVSIIHKDSFNIVLRSASIPKLEIPISKIKSIDEIDKSNFRDSSYRFPNPHATRYLYGPSAFSLKKGEGYYQNTMLLLNSFNVGLTNNISIGGGFELLSTFFLHDLGQIFFITPKVGFKVAEKFHAGGGVLYANNPDSSYGNRIGLGIAYGIVTYGTLDHNITGGFGWGFVLGEFQERPFITFSGMTRISKRTALVTENWLIPINNYYGLFSYGIRFFGEKMAVDLALIHSAAFAENLLIGIPYVSFIMKF